MARKPRFEYKERPADAVKKRAERQFGNFDSIFKNGFDTWTPKEGVNNIRILPPTWDDHDHYGLSIFVHSYVGSEKSTYLCPKSHGVEKKCPICAAAAQAKEDGDKEDANELKVSERVLFWILDRDGDDPNKPLLWSCSASMDRDIASLCYDNRTGKALVLDHPDEGYDVQFSRKGSKLNTRYFGIRIDRDSSPISSSAKKQEAILQYIQDNPLPDVLNFYPSSYLAEIISGTKEEKDKDLDRDDDDEDDTPRRGSKRAARDDDDEDDDTPRRGSSKRSARDDDDDDDDEPAPRKARARLTKDDDDEDDEPAPKRKARKPADDDEDDDEDDDDVPQIRKGGNRKGPEDDEDEDDEPAPKSKRRRIADDDDEEDDEPAPKKKRARDDDDDDDDEPAPRKRKRPADDDDDDEDDDAPPPRRGRR